MGADEAMLALVTSRGERDTLRGNGKTNEGASGGYCTGGIEVDRAVTGNKKK